MAGHVEIPNWINERTVERAYGRASEAQRRHEEGLAECGMRAAMARDPRLLLALEKGTEVMNAMMERQQGQTMRAVNTAYGHKIELTEVALWRTAYEVTDAGEQGVDHAAGLYNKLYPYRWVLAGAAELAGLRP